MGGEGSMQAMNTILKNNRELLRKKRTFDKEKSFSSITDSKLNFKQVDEKELEKIKRRIREKSMKDRRNSRLFLILVLVLLCFTFYFLFKDFYVDFDIFMRKY
ncbi:hypothetical protein [Tenacibaculum sp. IB213877]|uniref:hypothetical protein n=1 Tax=Tenacibaculum sp. IB213877 TaxID=3097351 RepID=UPI002A5AC490|nr:hypothetical protein [Tenacibaculum sp. IB213877]MDY0780949.1 hypothetical protein [Tenacibaculum sp. IB213877]